MFRTRLTEALGIEHPIVLAGMGIISNADLAAAVSNAGGLGVLGASMWGPGQLRREIERIKDLTDKPWGVDLLLAEGTIGFQDAMEIVLAAKAPVFVSGLGSPGKWVAPLHEQGATVMAMVGNVRHALRCAEDGVDIVVAQGHEAGGHTGRIATLALVPQVIGAVDPLPVAAAGGFVDGRGLVAALALGACGVVMGTRFIATPEAAAHVNYKQALVDATDNATVITRAYTGKTARALRNAYTDEWEKRPDELKPFPLQALEAGSNLVGAMLHGDMERGAAFAGQSSGIIRDVMPAAKVVRAVINEAESVLAEMARQYLAADASGQDPASMADQNRHEAHEG